jgi:hypothetical protein
MVNEAMRQRAIHTQHIAKRRNIGAFLTEKEGEASKMDNSVFIAKSTKVSEINTPERYRENGGGC